MKNKTEYKITLLCLKYIPVIMFLLMWFYMICAVFSITFPFSSAIAGCSVLPAILIFSLSSVFRFCWVHKTLTIYSFIADITINLNKYIFGFGTAILVFKWVMLIVGFIIFLMLLFKINRLTTACPKIKREVFK